MKNRLLILFSLTFMFLLAFLSSDSITCAEQNIEIYSEEGPKIQIGEIVFLSKYGAILRAIRVGQQFNLLVIVESLENFQGWGDEAFVGFWLEIWLDDEVRLANWGTGVYKGRFVIYSHMHTSIVFDDSGYHFFRVKLFKRDADVKGDLIEEQIVDFNVRGPILIR